jgi:hypothetical protein
MQMNANATVTIVEKSAISTSCLCIKRAGTVRLGEKV